MKNNVDVEQLASKSIDCALRIHKALGAGLLESAYEALLADALQKQGLQIERQKLVGIEFEGVKIEAGFRLDILVEGSLIIELKSVESLLPVHGKQLLTYLRLMNLPLGLLMNFGGATLKEGLRRIVNNHDNGQAMHLTVNQTDREPK